MEFFVIWFVFGLIAAIVAQTRGRNFYLWLLIGCATSIFGLIAAVMMKPQATQPTEDLSANWGNVQDSRFDQDWGSGND